MEIKFDRSTFVIEDQVLNRLDDGCITAVETCCRKIAIMKDRL